MKKYYIKFKNKTITHVYNQYTQGNYECLCDEDLHAKVFEYEVVSVDEENKTCVIEKIGINE